MLNRQLSTQTGLLSCYTFEDTFFDDTVHGFFTRKGGVSKAPWSSLNLSESGGDSRENVIENRARIFSAIQRPVESLYDVWQVHSTEVVFAEGPRALETNHVKADVILTNNPDVTLLMRFADCVPILLYDSHKKVVGIVHAGWQGTINNIAGIAIKKMADHYGSKPQDIVTGIGPSIGPDHYQVGTDVYEKAKFVFHEVHDDVFSFEKSSIYFNLWNANAYLLRSGGVIQIYQSNMCTGCDTENWFSHRLENGKTGRFAAVIGLKR